MALRQKTIAFAFPTDTGTTPDATLTNLQQITLFIPETVVAFQSCYVELGIQDVNASSVSTATITEHRCSLRLGAAGYSTIVQTDDIANTQQEQMAGIMGPFDFTEYFASSWAGTSMTCDVQYYVDQIAGSPTGVRNVTALLYVTYTYDDVAAVSPTQIKTAIIPLETHADFALQVVNSEVGSNQIPQLVSGGILPEASVVIRDYFFVIEGNEGGSSSTDWTLSVNVDSSVSPFSFGVQEKGQSTTRFCRWIYKPVAPDPVTAHQFQLWTTHTQTMGASSVTLYVTYEFNVSLTTRTLNTALLMFSFSSPLPKGEALGAQVVRKFFVQDPGAVVLRQSAVRIDCSAASSPAGGNLVIRVGDQEERVYRSRATFSAGHCWQHRIDGGGAMGAGFILSRGLNEVVVNAYETLEGLTTPGTAGITGLLIINYESDVGSQGVGQNTHSVRHVAYPWTTSIVAGSDTLGVESFALYIPEDRYWLTAAGFQALHWSSGSTYAYSIDVQRLPGEDGGVGYVELFHIGHVSQGSNRLCLMYWADTSNFYKRHEGDVDSHRLDATAEHYYRVYRYRTFGSNGLVALFTYNSFRYVVRGRVTGFAGDGSGIPVNIYRNDTKELVGSAVTASGGSFIEYWYDNTIDLFCEAREDAAHVGRSGLAKAEEE